MYIRISYYYGYTHKYIHTYRDSTIVNNNTIRTPTHTLARNMPNCAFASAYMQSSSLLTRVIATLPPYRRYGAISIPSR